MKIEWLVTDVTAVESPDRAERAIFGVILGIFGQFRPFLWWGATLWCRKPILSPNKLTYGDLMEIKGFVVNVTAVGSPDRAEHPILGVILAVRFMANSGRNCGRGAT